MAEHIITLTHGPNAGQQIVCVDHPSELGPLSEEALSAIARILDGIRTRLAAEQQYDLDPSAR
jgi:hypothetical protein